MTPNFQPIFLGSDSNVYGMARSFYEAYHIRSKAICSTKLAPTKYSKIIDIYTIPDVDHESVFAKRLHQFHQEQLDPQVTYLLIACGDHYAKLVSSYQNELKALYRFTTISTELYSKLEEKASFYQQCERYGLPYPKTIILTKDNQTDYLDPTTFPFAFPVVLKASDSISYVKLDFPGKKKAYTLDTLTEVQTVLNHIYTAGYTKEMILQEFIPGDDSHMRVMNVYIDQHHEIRSLALGHPILEDPSPASIGNYVAILPDENKQLEQQIEHFLRAIGYTGFANFDFKYDARDQTYKVFEINLRQGRSSFFATLMGCNLAIPITEELIFQTPRTKTIYPTINKIWLGAPMLLIYHYTKHKELRKQLRHAFFHHHYGSTLFYKKDFSCKRWLLQTYAFARYTLKFRRYFTKQT